MEHEQSTRNTPFFFDKVCAVGAVIVILRLVFGCSLRFLVPLEELLANRDGGGGGEGGGLSAFSCSLIRYSRSR